MEGLTADSSGFASWLNVLNAKPEDRLLNSSEETPHEGDMQLPSSDNYLSVRATDMPRNHPMQG
jgi:hypothetical protein